MLVTIDLSPRACSRCGARHRSQRTQISCYYPNAWEVQQKGERLSWVVADIFTHYDDRRRTDTFTVYLTLFDSRHEAQEFVDDRNYRALSFLDDMPPSGETRIVQFGKFIPGASMWQDAPSRRKQ